MGRCQEQRLLHASRLRHCLCRSRFLRPAPVVVQDRRRDYGEDRYQLIGTIDGRAYVVVYTVRGSAIRIISARKANRKEISDYEYNAYQD